MNRENVKKMFENMGSRLTIRTGTSTRGDRSPVRINVAMDRHGEHFTLTLNPLLDEEKTIIQVLDTDKKHRQMLLNLVYWTIPEEPIKPSRRSSVKKWVDHDAVERSRNSKPEKVVEKLLVGHDEMHWFVAGVSGANSIKEAFERLRPNEVTLAAKRSGVRRKDIFRHKTKGFIRQGEWFFVPAMIGSEKDFVIHKNEPISRQGGTPHIVEELIRFGGEKVYVGPNQKIISEKEYKKLVSKESRQASLWELRMRGAKVFGRGKVKHKDHHTIVLKGWHEIHLSTERTATGGSNAFID